jgi:hypothetical protein
LATIVALAACGQVQPTTSPASDEGTAAIASDLALGARGVEVIALQDYLDRYGYFPNETVAKAYPMWRPATTQTPTRGVFDETTRVAVKAFQKNMSLPQVGVVDADTRALLRSARCGVPDGIPRFDPSDKFDISTFKWNITNLTYFLVGSTPPGASATIAAGFATWMQYTGLSFSTLNSTSANIYLSFGTPIVHPNALAETTFPVSGSGETHAQIVFNNTVNWSTSGTPGPNQYDLRTVATHEIGHALGINHSSFSNAIMFPTLALGTVIPINLDDMAAISTIYDNWSVEPVNVGATDIGNGADGSAWIIGNDRDANGNSSIFKLINGTWVQDTSGGRAARIAVGANGRPWIANAAGNIFQRTTNSPTSGGWGFISGAGAKDIGAGFDGEVWIITTTPFDQSGNFTIKKFNGSGWDSPVDGGGAVRIAVGPEGVPWIVNAAGTIFRRTNNRTTDGAWSVLPGNGSATDIGVGDDNGNGGQYAWMIGTTLLGAGGFNIAVWDEQPAGSVGSPPAQAQARWIPFPGAATAIAVGPRNLPMVVNALGNVFIQAR